MRAEVCEVCGGVESGPVFAGWAAWMRACPVGTLARSRAEQVAAAAFEEARKIDGRELDVAVSAWINPGVCRELKRLSIGPELFEHPGVRFLVRGLILGVEIDLAGLRACGPCQGAVVAALERMTRLYWWFMDAGEELAGEAWGRTRLMALGRLRAGPAIKGTLLWAVRAIDEGRMVQEVEGAKPVRREVGLGALRKAIDEVFDLFSYTERAKR